MDLKNLKTSKYFSKPIVVAIIAISMSLYHLYTGFIGQPIPEIHRPMHLLFGLIVLFLVNPSTKSHNRIKYIGIVWDIFIIGVTLASCIYLIINAEYLQQRMVYVYSLTSLQIILGVGLIIALLDAVRRVLGWVLVGVVSLFLIYGMVGQFLPYPFWHRGYSLSSIIETVYLTSEGIFTIPIGVTASYIFLFVLFGALLISSGAGEFFINLAKAITGRTFGGPAKTAVVSSSFMAMLSGSSASNVVTTGSFTIPTMKRCGYEPSFAAGVEAVASNGGTITPPIMGAAAFVMMGFLGISYTEIMLRAAIPAFLYFFAIFLEVDLEARRLNLRLSEEKIANTPSVWSILKSKGYMLLPIIVMVVVILKGYTPAKAALWSIITLALLFIIFDKERRHKALHVFNQALQEAPVLIGPVVTACACGGIIVGMLTLTGLGLRMSAITLSLSGGNLIVLLVLTMVAGVILGMGMPTSGAYIILAALLAPGVVKLGVPPIPTHFFILYCASISSITPPVAIASYAAAAVANADPWRTSLTAIKLGLSGFIIPYMFVYGPQLLGFGNVMQVIMSVLTTMTGIIFLSITIIGWFLKNLKWSMRIIYLFSALMMIAPEWRSDLIGLILGFLAVGITLINYKKVKNSRKLKKITN